MTITDSPRFARSRAKAQGLTRYISNRRCPKGHIGERHTTNGCCCACNAEWKINNRPQVLAASKAYMKDPEVRTRRRKYEMERYAARPDLVVTARMRARIYSSLKGRTKSWRKMVPYTVGQLKRHIESQFLPGMSWENMGKWEIDHIVPVKAFNIKRENDEAFNACWALTNLRPMWKSDNRKKSFTRTHLL